MSMEDFVLKVSNLGYVWPDSVSVAAMLGRAWSQEEKTLWRKLMHSCYTPMALSAGYAIFGRQLSLKNAAHLNKAPEAWRNRVLEAKGLAPLLGPRVALEAAPPENLKQLREGLLRRGLSPLSWKWLYKQNLSVCRLLFTNGVSYEPLFWTNMLARAQPDKAFSSQYLEGGRLYESQPLYWLARAESSPTALLTQIERLCRLLPAEATPQSKTEASLLTQAVLVNFREGDMHLEIAAGSTWANLVNRVRQRNRVRDEEVARAYEERIRENNEAAAQQLERDSKAWPAKIGSGEKYGIQFEELTSNKELVLEGLAMNHCLKDGGYTLACRRGTSAIFKLRDLGSEQRATLQLSRPEPESPKWVIGQLQSFGNTQVPLIFWKAARELAEFGGFEARKAA